jgi:UDP-N-acetyl-D-glucosamine dehydrogenase
MPATNNDNPSPNNTQSTLQKFVTGNAHVAIIGLGYVGLPLGVTLAEAGYRVTGIDVDRRKIDCINRGESYVSDVSHEELAAVVLGNTMSTNSVSTNSVSRDNVDKTHTDTPQSAQNNLPQHRSNSIQSTHAEKTEARGSFTATTDYAVLETCDAISICVPTPLRKTGDPDLSYIVNATESVARHLQPGQVIVLESTTYPGTTTEVLLPSLREQARRRHGREFEVGKDFFLAFSPERVDPGRSDWVTRNTPKVLGGTTPACLEMATAFYGRAIETIVPVTSPAAAEMVKLFENTFRSVNIALANELLLMCDKLELDAWEILEAASTKPFGFMKFTPGPGLGGHCIPIDPHYLSWKMRTMDYTARFIQLASEVNTAMPAFWVQRVQDALNEAAKPVKGSSILVLGVAYKRDVSDTRESPALDIIHLLSEKGATVSYHDPFVPTLVSEGLELVSVADVEEGVESADCVVIVTDHSTYSWPWIRDHANLIIDTRHVLPE